MYELLASLCGCDCISGRESALHDHILNSGSFSRHATDALGTLLCFQDAGPGAPTVLLDAHADEIGFIVRHIDKDGFIFADPVGGIDPKVLLGSRLTVHGKRTLSAVVGDLPPHVSADKAIPKTGDLPIDTGLEPHEVRKLVGIGDAITFFSPLARIGKNQVAGKALDNRAGCAVLCELSKRVESPYNLIYAFSAQEEVGARGITPAMYSRDVSFAVCVDTTHGDMTGVEPHKTRPLGSGPILGRGPGIHPAVGAAAESAAASAGVPHTVKAYSGAMPTNLRSIQISGSGIPGTQVSIPARYLHTPCEVADLRDIDGCVTLLYHLLSHIDSTLMEAVGCC